MKGGKMMWILDLICKIVGLFSCSLNIVDKIRTYHSRNKKDPSGLAACDGSRDESLDS